MCLFRGTQITALLQGLLSMSSSPGTRIKPSVKNKYSVYSFVQNVTPPSKVLMHHLVLNTFPKAGSNSDKHQHLTIWGQASYCSDVLSEVGPFPAPRKETKRLGPHLDSRWAYLPCPSEQRVHKKLGLVPGFILTMGRSEICVLHLTTACAGPLLSSTSKNRF